MTDESKTPTPVSSSEGSKAEAFDRIVAARKAQVDLTTDYNARLRMVRAERDIGNWSLKVDDEYRAMSDAQSEFIRVAQSETDAALSATATEGE